MKRQPAVIGPTPPFVRWAVDFDCIFRDNSRGNIPAAAFQQLRSLAEVSEGVAEGRCFRGYCFARNTHPDLAVSEVKAIDIREVVGCFGSLEELNRTCNECPANGHDVSRQPAARWSGCFGYLSADPAWSPESSSLSTTIACDLVNWFNRSIDAHLQEFRAAFPAFQAGWYGLWRCSRFAREQLVFLRTILESIERMDGLEIAEANIRELHRLTRSVELAIDNNLTIEFELVPAGHSDGVFWVWESHCRVCRFTKSTQTCESCGDKTVAVSGKKRRVLGDRPYLRIAEILDLASLEALVGDYLQRSR